MYLVRLRAHLSKGRIALGDAIEAVAESVPTTRSKRRNTPGE